MAPPWKPGRLHRRGPSLRRSVMVDSVRGVPRIRAWPRKRGKNLHPKTLDQMEWFRQANKLAKYIHPREQITALEATHGTPLLPRDLQLMAMSGRLWSISLSDRRIIYSMAAANEVSKSLDVLGQTPGDILARSKDLWIALPPGTPGQVLVTAGPGEQPQWMDVTFVPQAPSVQGIAWAGAATGQGNFATKGRLFQPSQAAILAGIVAPISNPSTPQSYRFEVAEVDRPDALMKIISDPASTVDAQETVDGHALCLRLFEAPLALLPGKIYLLAMVRTDGSGTSQAPAIFTSGGGEGISLPGQAWNGTFDFASIGLSIGQSPDNSSANTYLIWPYA